MAYDRDRMHRKVRKACGTDEDDPELTDDDIDEYLNLAYWEVQNKFPFREKEKTGTFNTVAGTRNYDMPKPFEALQSLAVEDPNTYDYKKLDQMDPDVYESVYKDSTDSRGMPTHYVREGCFARLYPTPDKAYKISIKRLITLTDISTSHTSLEIPQVWWEIVTMGAQWRALLDFGDIEKANAFKNHQVSLINTTVPVEVKEKDDNRHAGLQVIGRDYDQTDYYDFYRR